MTHSRLAHIRDAEVLRLITSKDKMTRLQKWPAVACLDQMTHSRLAHIGDGDVLPHQIAEAQTNDSDGISIHLSS